MTRSNSMVTPGDGKVTPKRWIGVTPNSLYLCGFKEKVTAVTPLREKKMNKEKRYIEQGTIGFLPSPPSPLLTFWLTYRKYRVTPDVTPPSPYAVTPVMVVSTSEKG